MSRRTEMDIDVNKINIFLHYGYIPDPDIKLPESLKNWITGITPKYDYTKYTKAELIKIGADKLRSCIKEEIGDDYNKIHIVPLSGGLDSRAILAVLLEHIDSSKIITVSFGVPGAYDYEIAQKVAKEARVKWEGIDLSPGKWKWNTDSLVKTAISSIKPNRIFDTIVNYEIPRRFGKDCIYWSGFMGDPLAGSHLPKKNYKSWTEAKKDFALRYRKLYKVDITPKCFDAKLVLPTESYTSPERLNYYEQLDFCIRQCCFIHPIVSDKRYNYKFPFLNKEWVNFILSCSSEYRENQYIYKKILKTSYPLLFTKNNRHFNDRNIFEKLMRVSGKHFRSKYLNKINKIKGLKTRPTHNVNYIDFNYALREQKDFKELIWSNLYDLINRNMISWVNIEYLWNVHQKGTQDLYLELLTLASLEIQLKTNNIK